MRKPGVTQTSDAAAGAVGLVLILVAEEPTVSSPG